MKRILTVLLLIMTLLLVTACGGGTGEGGSGSGSGSGSGEGTGGGTGGGNDTCTVTLVTSDGITVTTANPVTVNRGEDATFTLTLGKTYRIIASEDESFSYDASTGILTVSNVQRNMRVTAEAENLGYDTTVVYNYYFKGTSSDRSSKNTGTHLNGGTTITVTAGNEEKLFLGWTLGGYLEQGGKLMSGDREYTFDISPETTVNGSCYIFANYSDTLPNVLYYHPNGGMVDVTSTNMTHSQYYTVETTDTFVKITLKTRYFEQAGACASLFWDDGSFYRPGYVLKEFNTKEDGSGVGYSLGSKFALNTGSPILYCIWAEDTAHSDFTYEDVTYGYASGVSSATAPHWQTNGVKITGYNGNEKEVVIPEFIEGKPVTAIAAEAFVNKRVETLVLSRFLLNVADNAFVNCTSLKTIHYPDSIYVINNEAFDTASWAGVQNFYVNATMAPRMSGDGSFAKKLTRFMSNSDKKRIAIVSGSSSFQGLSGEYLEKLLGEEYCVINFGTTRTTHTYLYLALLGLYANENDLILYAPENSIYEMGEPEFYWKTLRDMEGMYNVFRAIDISNYTNVIGSFQSFNRGTDGSPQRYSRSPNTYENILISGYGGYVFGEYDHNNRHQYMQDSIYRFSEYQIRLDKLFCAKTDTGSPTGDLVDITLPVYADNMNDVIERCKASGAKVYYSFAPMSEQAIIAEAKEGGAEYFDAFEKLIMDTYVFDGVLGNAEDYIFNVTYFYDNAFHPNDYGRVHRTYRVYLDVCELLHIDSDTPYNLGKLVSDLNLRETGKDGIRGCMFEVTPDGFPIYKVEFLQK